MLMKTRDIIQKLVDDHKYETAIEVIKSLDTDEENTEYYRFLLCSCYAGLNKDADFLKLFQSVCDLGDLADQILLNHYIMLANSTDAAGNSALSFHLLERLIEYIQDFRMGMLNPVVVSYLARKNLRSDLIQKSEKSYREKGSNISNLSEEGCEKSPPVLLITLPKAASLFLATNISNLYGYSDLRISLDFFPDDHVFPSSALQLSKGGYLAWSHINASKHNLKTLYDSGVTKFVIQIRDPRQALLSFVHHTRDNLTGPAHHFVNRLIPKIDSEWFDLSLYQQIDTYIDEWFPAAIKWLADWLDVIDNDPNFSILFLRFEDMQNREAETVEGIAQFLNLSHVPTDIIPMEQNNHFRSGQIDEWKMVLSQEQCDRVNGLFPKALAERLGYELL